MDINIGMDIDRQTGVRHRQSEREREREIARASTGAPRQAGTEESPAAESRLTASSADAKRGSATGATSHLLTF